jgi:hypothetical protein
VRHIARTTPRTSNKLPLRQLTQEQRRELRAHLFMVCALGDVEVGSVRSCAWRGDRSTAPPLPLCSPAASYSTSLALSPSESPARSSRSDALRSAAAGAVARASASASTAAAAAAASARARSMASTLRARGVSGGDWQRRDGSGGGEHSGPWADSRATRPHGARVKPTGNRAENSTG